MTRGFPKKNRGAPELPPSGSYSKRTGKEIATEDSDSESENKAVPSLSSNLKNPNWRKAETLPKCPSPDRMFNWTIEDYRRYDEFLIAKWTVLGFGENETVYMSIKDQNSLLARKYRSLYQKWKNQMK